MRFCGGSKRDERKGEAIERSRQPVMRFRKINAATDFLVRSGELWIEQLRKIPLAGFAFGGALRTGILIEVEHIAVEFQHRQPRAIELGPLDIAVQHDQACAL